MDDAQRGAGQDVLDAYSRTAGVLIEVGRERVRQDAKFGPVRDYRDGTGGADARAAAELLRHVCQTAPDTPEGDTWAKVLAEEVAEAIAEVDDDPLRRELVQVAAVAVAWVQDLDRRRTGGER
jgi:hypothetical protein